MNYLTKYPIKMMFLLCLFSAAFILSGCNKEYSGIGTIQGSMIVSEDCIENRCPIADYSDIYASRKLIIYSAENNTPIAHLRLENDGTFSYNLPPGEYTLDLINDHYDITYDMPKNFKIEENKTNNVEVNIAIDRNDQP